MFTTFINNKFLLYLTLFGVALSLLLQFGVKPIVEGDAGSYIQCANAFYNGKPQECTPIRTPGYPLFILITNTIFQNLNYQLTVTIQYFLILGTAYYIYLLALLLFQNKTIGYVSYFLIITNPVFIFYSNNILTDNPFLRSLQELDDSYKKMFFGSTARIYYFFSMDDKKLFTISQRIFNRSVWRSSMD